MNAQTVERTGTIERLERKMAKLPDPLTVSETAGLLRCSQSHTRDCIHRDGLKGVKVGAGRGLIVVFQEDLRRYIEKKLRAGEEA